MKERKFGIFLIFICFIQLSEVSLYLDRNDPKAAVMLISSTPPPPTGLSYLI